MERRTLHSAMQLVSRLYAAGLTKHEILKLKERIDHAYNHSMEFETTLLNGKEYPILYAQKLRGNKYWKTLPCLFCGNRHTHRALQGHRVPHCEDISFDEISLKGHVFKRTDGYVVKLLQLRQPIIDPDIQAYKELKEIKAGIEGWGSEAALKAMKLIAAMLNYADERGISISEQNYIVGYVCNTLQSVRVSKTKDYQTQAYRNKFSKAINLTIRQFKKYYEHLERAI